jgi:hypothetical protein
MSQRMGRLFSGGTNVDLILMALASPALAAESDHSFDDQLFGLE